MSDFSDVKWILDKIAEASSTNEKQRIIAENADNALFVKVVDYALDPYKTFKMTKLWPITVYKRPGSKIESKNYNPDYVFIKLDEFCGRMALADLDKIGFTEWVVDQGDMDLIDVISRILKKDLRCGASIKLFKKASDKFSFLPEHFPMKGIDDYEKFLKHAKGAKICVSPKLDGCFRYDTPILLADGTTMPIGKIVEERLSVDVLSFDKSTGKVCKQRVVNWFNNGNKPNTEWCRVKQHFPNHLHVSRQGYKVNSRNFVTLGHNYYTPDGLKQAQQLKTAYQIERVLSDTQEQLILGACLGDASVCYDHKNYRICFVHSEKQADYFHTKISAIQEFTNTIRKKISGYGSSILSVTTGYMPLFAEIRRLLFPNGNVGKREIPQEYLDRLSYLALAIWYLDDGAKHQSKDDGDENVPNVKTRASLFLYRYSEQTVARVSNWFADKGFFNSVYSCEHGNWITFTVEGTKNFFEKISPYVPSCMAYKISKEFRDNVGKIKWWEEQEKSWCVYEIPVSVSGITEYYNHAYTAYDIEVENTHNYFANGLLVSNSRTYAVTYPDHVVFLSSNGKEIPNFQCLAEEFLELRLLMLRDYCQQFGTDEKDTIIFDGEVINIQGDFSKHMSQFRRLHEMDDSGFRFCIFDLVVDNVPFKDRYNFLSYHICQHLQDVGYRLKHWPNDSEYHFALVCHALLVDDAREICKRMVEEGFEGIMLKTLDHVYERKRSNSWCKMKPTYTEDFPVVDKVEGTGKYKGVLGALVIDRNGTKVEVGSGFTDEERKEFWENPPKAIEVKYQESLESGSLRFPIFVRVRDDWQPDNN